MISKINFFKLGKKGQVQMNQIFMSKIYIYKRNKILNHHF